MRRITRRLSENSNFFQNRGMPGKITSNFSITSGIRMHLLLEGLYKLARECVRIFGVLIILAGNYHCFGSVNPKYSNTAYIGASPF